MRKKFIIKPSEQNSDSFINILPALEFVPEWYRLSKSQRPGTFSELDLGNPIGTNSTYKKCTPFFDALTIGYMVYLSADIEVVRKQDGSPYIVWRTNRTIVTEHTNEQWEGLPVPDGYSPFVYKWHNQFLIKTPKDYSLLFTNPINRFDLPFSTITGIVDCDSYDLAVHFPFFIKNNFTGIIEKGTPITQIIPIKRETWERNITEFNENEINILKDKYFSTIKRSYKNNHWFRKEYK